MVHVFERVRAAKPRPVTCIPIDTTLTTNLQTVVDLMTKSKVLPVTILPQKVILTVGHEATQPCWLSGNSALNTTPSCHISPILSIGWKSYSGNSNNLWKHPLFVHFLKKGLNSTWQGPYSIWHLYHVLLVSKLMMLMTLKEVRPTVVRGLALQPCVQGS